MNQRADIVASSGKVDLYAKAPKIHPRSIKGRFQRLRLIVRWLLIGAWAVTPWLQWEGRQAVLFDLPARQFHIFGVTFWPQDFVIVAWLLIVGAYALFTVTNALGRAWCGYACPQSVWFSLFIWIEEQIEGPRHQRIKLDKAPWDGTKLARKAFKHAVWLAVSIATGLTIVGYFVPIRELLPATAALQIAGWTLFWVGFFTTATYVMGALLREQVCLYMCPYARFQSAMFDTDTLIVSYDAGRGEPRGSRARKADPQALGLGDCVDCEMCVQVCPVGIDIRDGLQYECISCALCIDACDSIMDRMGYDRGLVRYTTEHALAGQPTRFLRPRLLGYAAVLMVMLVAVAVLALGRVPAELAVLRDRNALYNEVQTADGPRIQNAYTLRVANMSQHARSFRLEAEGAMSLEWVGEATLRLEGGDLRTLPVLLRAPTAPAAVNRIEVRLLDADSGEIILSEEATFLAPAET